MPASDNAASGDAPEHLEPADELIAERRELHDLPPDMPGWMAATITRIDAFALMCGKVICWLTVPIFGAMTIEVIMSKFFTPTLWAFDISRMLYGALFMLGSGYALMRGVHIRADFLYRLWAPKVQGAVDFFLYVLLYFPAVALFFWTSADYAWDAWKIQERLDDTAWRPLAAPARTAMPVGAFLLLVQGVSELLKSYYTMTRGRKP